MTSMNTLTNDRDHWELLPLSTKSPCTSWSSPKRERLSTVKKKSAVFKRAMTEKRERWQHKEWCGKNEIPLVASCLGRRWTKLA